MSKTHGQSRTRLYRIWGGMMERCGHWRCCNPDAITYYIAKGIEVCREWREFTAFFEWAQANGYADDLTIDRIDSDSHYCAENCRWISMRENLRARADRKLTMADAADIRYRRSSGESGADLAAEYGISRNYVYRVANRRAWA